MRKPGYKQFLPLLIVSALLYGMLNFRKKEISVYEPGYDYLAPLLNAGFTRKTAEYLIAVSAFETGNFTSKVFRENNNLFGMKEPVQRTTLATGTKNNHASFRNTDASIQDMRMYWNALEYPENFDSLYDLISFMKSKGYFTANLNHYYNETKKYYDAYWQS